MGKKTFDLIKNPEPKTPDSICRCYEDSCLDCPVPVKCWLSSPERGICPIINTSTYQGED